MSTFCRRTVDLTNSTNSELPSVVDSADAALAVIANAAQHPQQSQVVALVLDDDLRGNAVVIVDGTESPDAVIDVVELLVQGAAEADRPATLVVATIRPDLGDLPGDADRWLELSELAEEHGCELLEWFIISGDVAWCPRDLLAEPPRWP
jgi:hypothetical protein